MRSSRWGAQRSLDIPHYWVSWGPVRLCPRLHIARSRLGLLVGRKVWWEEGTQVRLLEAVGAVGGPLRVTDTEALFAVRVQVMVTGGLPPFSIRGACHLDPGQGSLKRYPHHLKASLSLLASQA